MKTGICRLCNVLRHHDAQVAYAEVCRPILLHFSMPIKYKLSIARWNNKIYVFSLVQINIFTCMYLKCCAKVHRK
jgi:hypothetical protein